MSYPASLNSTRAIVFGSILALGGLVLLVIAVSARDDSPLFMLGGLVFIGGIVRLTTALSKDARRRRSYLNDPSDPRWHGGSGTVQLAGRPCIECKQRIIIGTDAISCEACTSPVHLTCEAQHKSRAHAHAFGTELPSR
jgi:hypothetical protein